MALLTREQILKAQDRTYKEVNCPEWGGKVRIQSLTGAERDAFEDSNMSEPDAKGNRKVKLANIRARLVALAAVDKDGKPLFSKDDVMVLGEKNAAALDRCFSVAQKLAGLSRDDVEEMVKNSGTAQKDDSPSV